MMLPEDTSSSIVAKVSSNQNLSKTLEGFSMVYRTADSKGFKIEPDKFGGFGLSNKTGRVLKPKLEPIHENAGIIEDIPTDLREKLTPLSIMKSSSTSRKVVLLGVARFVKHSCMPNTRYFQGYSCDYLRYRNIRLQVIRSIHPDEKITVDYGDSFFGSIDECKYEVCTDANCTDEPSTSFLTDERAERRSFDLLVKSTMNEESTSGRAPSPILEEDAYVGSGKSSNVFAQHYATAGQLIEETERTHLTLLEQTTSSARNKRVGKRKYARKYKPQSKSCKLLKGADIIDSFIEQTQVAHLIEQSDVDDDNVSDHDCNDDKSADDIDSDDNSINNDNGINDNAGQRDHDDVDPTSNSSNESDNSELCTDTVNSDSSAEDSVYLDAQIEKTNQSSSAKNDSDEGRKFKFSFNNLCENSNVSIHNSMISLLSIVTKHGCSDELLYDLIKRKRVIYPSSEFPPPFAVKKLIPDVAKNYIRSHQIYENGQLICLNFLKQLRAVVYQNLEQIFEYNSKRDSTSDKTFQSLVKDNTIKIKIESKYRWRCFTKVCV